MGYDPVYDPDSGKIIIKKDNNDQIITEIKDSFLIQEFNNYEGKDCATDINKIKNRLSSLGALPEGVKYDLEWYQPLEKAKNKANYKKDNELYMRLKNVQKNTTTMKK
jgi:copper chaperone CopZ